MTELTESFGCDDLRDHAGRIRALARTVATDENGADDLAQNALMQELRREDDGRPKNRGWFVGLLRNLARKEHRSAERRRRREATVARECHAAPAAEVVQHAETLQQVVAAAMELDEPYRTTILLRYLEDRSVDEVAAAMQVPASTVRVRTKRAVERLRESLRRSLGDGYALLLLSLAAPQPVPTPWASPSSLTQTPEPGPMNLIFSKPAALCIGAALLASTPFVLDWSERTEVPPFALDEASADARRDGAGADVAAHTSVVATAGREAESAGGVAMESQAVHPPFSRKVVDRGGNAVVGALVKVYERSFEGSERYRTGDFVAAPAEATTDDAGVFTLGEIHPFATWGVEVSKDGFATTYATVRPDKTDAIVLHAATDLVGEVRDAASGVLLEGVAVRVFAFGVEGGLARRARTVFTDEDGAYRLQGVRAGSRLKVEFQRDGFAPWFTMVNLAADSENRFDARIGTDANASITVVDDATNSIVVGASVRVHGYTSTALGTTDEQGRIDVPLAWVADASAVSAFDGGAGVSVHKDGYCTTARRLPRATAAGSTALEIRLVLSARVEGSVRDLAGQPVEGARVNWFGAPLRFVEPRSSGVCGYDSMNAVTDADGRFVLPNVLPKGQAVEGELRAYHGGAMARVANALPPVAGGVHTIEMTLGGGFDLAGRSFINNVAAATWVTAKEVGNEDNRVSTQTTADGQFGFFDLAPGTYRLTARAADGTSIASAPLDVELDGDASDVELHVQAAVTQVHGRVLTDEGLPAVGRTVLAFRVGDADPDSDPDEEDIEIGCDGSEDGAAAASIVSSLAHVDANGNFTLSFPTDPQARYLLGVYQGAFGVTASNVAQGATGIELRVPRMAKVRVEVTRAQGGAPVQRAGIRWAHPASERNVTLAWNRPWPTDNGTLDLELPIGELTLTLRDADTGNETSLEIVVPDGGDSLTVQAEL